MKDMGFKGLRMEGILEHSETRMHVFADFSNFIQRNQIQTAHSIKAICQGYTK